MDRRRGNHRERCDIDIECKGNVTISGGTVERGGSLRIDAGGEIMIQKGFEAKIGANVEFK